MKRYVLTLALCLLAITNSMVAADVVTIDNFSILPGETKNVNISLANESEYVAFQFDLYLPDSLTVESYSVDRSRIPESTTLSMTRQQDGSYRFITMAINGDHIAGTSGPIVNVSVRANEEMAFGERTGYFRQVKLSRSNATGPTYNEMPFPVTLVRPRFAIRYYVDGKLLQVDSIGYGLSVLPITPSKEGYTFSGWSGLPSTMPNYDVDVTGSFSINSYVLTYKVDGFYYYSETLVFGTPITPLAPPSKDGFTFLGWSKIPDTMPANNMEIVGHFIEAEHDSTTVSGDDAGWGDGYNLIYKVDGQIYKTIVYESGGIITAEPEPIKEGYTFSGWSEIPATMPENDVEIIGIFSVNSYTLTYKVDGDIYKTVTLDYSTVITAEEVPAREGYTFSGWSEIPVAMPANDVEITGSFSINSYNLAYKVDGVLYKSSTVVYGSDITAEPVPTKVGYTFSGWSEIPSAMPANDVEITGNFSINSYSLVYKVDGATYKSMSVVYGSQIIAEVAPAREGYTFSGWSEIPSTMPANDVEITGTFSINSYNLVYKVDGTTYKSISVVYGSEITPEVAPTKEGYTFSGWSEIPATMPSNDVEISGTFSVNSYNLVYIVDGEPYKTLLLNYGSSITAEPDPTREGYTFSGWSGLLSTMPASDVEITGTFSVNSYSLVYRVDGATYKSISVVYGSEITPEVAPTKEGYTFSGWSEIPATMPSNDVEISGTFSVNSYNLVYIVDGEPYKTLLLNYGSSITAEPDPTREGYTFSGWSGLLSTMPASDVEITGTFSVNSYSLVYKVDGAVYKSLSIVYGSEITAEVAPTKEGYTFSGWSEIPATMPASDVEISGTFSVNSYNLVYKVDGATYKTQILDYGSSITAESAPVREGYTFSGWSEIPSTMPANDVEITGTFNVNSYNLIYKVDGETYKTISLNYGLSITAEPAPVREGYTFSGWSEIPATMPSNDVEISGTFSVNSYNLVYIVDGETYKSLSVEYGSSITAEPEPTKEGSTFSGWSGIPSTMPARDVEITGSFDANSYKLIYKLDGEIYKSSIVKYGSEITAEPAPVREGYTFSGWSEIPSTMPASDVEISGTFSVNFYDLVYKVDGETYKTMSLDYGSSITAEPAPVREGYIFSGWSTIPITMPADDVEISGTFSINSYNLVYKVDGIIYKSLSVVYGSEITQDVAPTKEGYTFSGWSEIPSTMPASDVEITGTFNINSYNLVYTLDGETYKTITVEFGTSITPEPDPAKEGFTFLGWSGLPSIMPAKDVEVTGTLSVNSYNLVYKVDGEPYKTLVLNYGSSITAEPNPTKEGYTFSGWSGLPSTMPASDVEITGSFSVNSYSLVYKVDGATYKSMSVVYGSEITIEIAPTKEGYTFSGWSGIPSTMPASDIEITGTFNINSYNLVYMVDGEIYRTMTVEYGSLITPEPEPTKEGSTFTGWSGIPSTMPARDVEITGSFDANSYKLIYKLDGEIYKSSIVKYGSEITAEPAPVREGYTFSGWSEIPSTMPSSDVEITGTFSVNSYNLVYIVDGETYKTMSLDYGSSITAEPNPIKEGYTFSGWSEMPSTMPSSDVEITGAFNINSYNLVYKVDGETYKTVSFDYGSSITAEPDPIKEGYTFSGWSTIPSTMPANDVEVTATFSVNSYNLVYTVDGEPYKTLVLYYGSSITVEPDPTKEGYTFSGWNGILSTMPANDVEITGTFNINSYQLVYKVDGATYKSLSVFYGNEITPEIAPVKEGYTFSGWSTIPSTMPANDVEITGSFTVNKYLLSVLIDGAVVYSDSIAYGTRLADYVDLIKEYGIDITQWEWYSQIETITMPAHDVVINAVLNSVRPIREDIAEDFIYDLSGKKMETDDISTLPAGMYIRNGRKFIVR